MTAPTVQVMEEEASPLLKPMEKNKKNVSAMRDVSSETMRHSV